MGIYTGGISGKARKGMQWVSKNKNVEETGTMATKPSKKKQRDNRVRGIRYTFGAGTGSTRYGYG